MTDAPLPRPMPAISGMNEYFWCGGADGRLHILCCEDCDTFVHPYVGRCRACGSKVMAPRPVSGRASVCSFTVNHQPWFPHVPTPYVIAYVEIDEQEDVRLATNIVNCEPDSVRIGMPVQVLFERHGDIFVPLFEPAAEGSQ